MGAGGVGCLRVGSREGVGPPDRLGALRLRREGGPFLDDNTEHASPLWTSLRELAQAGLQLERQGAERKAKYGAWESIAHALARRAGVHVAEGRRERFRKGHHTFLTRRFDRTEEGGRIHFASAMTMLERADGEPGASYLDLAGVLMQHGAHAPRDLEQLWRRIVFVVCVSNTDDHLRNHGFLLEGKGGSLAPAYDMNPVPHGDGLTLNTSATDNAQDLELVLDVARHFRVKSAAAKTIVGEVAQVVRGWRAEARRAGIARAEQDRMANAFRVAEGRA